MNSLSTRYCLHICEESAFLLDTIKIFNECDGWTNFFLINSDYNHHGSLDLTDYKNSVRYNFKSEEYQQIINEALTKANLVIFHNIGIAYKSGLAKLFYEKVPLHGILWGFEVYAGDLLNSELYQPITLDVLLNNQLIKLPSQSIKTKLRNVIKPRIKFNRYWSIMESLSSFSTIIEQEKSFLKSRFNYSKKWLPFIYYGRHDDGSKVVPQKRNWIWLGNSSSPYNNHLDLLQKLSSCKDVYERLYVPLSYGDDKYRDLVVSKFQNELKEKFYPIVDFLDIEAYRQHIGSCAFVVMNHLRQQGIGNIAIAINSGAKLFIHPSSLLYGELRRLGFVIYSVDQIGTEIKAFETEENIVHNRKVLQEWRNFPNAVACAKTILRNYE